MSSSLTSIYDNIAYALQLHGKAITKLQEQASSGNRVNRASDSPSDAYRIIGLNSQDRSLASYLGRVTELMDSMEMSSSLLADMASDLADARTAVTQIVGGIYDAEGQKQVANRLNNTLEQLVSLANTKEGNQYLFGGTDTSSAPYRVVREDGKITQVIYEGSDEARSINVAPGMEVETFHVGDDIFRSDSRGEPIFLGETGAKAGTGTSNVRGDVWLTVDHDGTNYRLSIDDGATFVTVPAGGQTNQAVTDSRTGRVLYVDTTGINSTGVEMVRVPGTYDIFGTLISLRDALINERGVPRSELLDFIDRGAAAIEEVRNLVVQTNTATGSKIAFLNTLKNHLEDTQFNVMDETTRLQQADVSQIAIDLSRREILYQMSLSVAGKLLSTSLLDFVE